MECGIKTLNEEIQEKKRNLKFWTKDEFHLLIKTLIDSISYLHLQKITLNNLNQSLVY